MKEPNAKKDYPQIQFPGALIFLSSVAVEILGEKLRYRTYESQDEV